MGGSFLFKWPFVWTIFSFKVLLSRREKVMPSTTACYVLHPPISAWVYLSVPAVCSASISVKFKESFAVEIYRFITRYTN